MVENRNPQPQPQPGAGQQPSGQMSVGLTGDDTVIQKIRRMLGEFDKLEKKIVELSIADNAAQDISKLNDSFQDAGQSAEKSTGFIQKLADSISDLWQSAKNFVGDKLAKEFDFAQEVLQTEKSFELLRVQMGILFRNAEEGKKVFDWIYQLHTHTPFATQDLVGLAVAMKSVGLDPRAMVQGREFMKDIGDLAAATGQDLQQAFFSVQQAVNQNIFYSLFRNFSISKDQIIKGMKEIGQEAKFDTPKQRMESLAVFMRTRFGGGMEELSHKWGGIMQALGDRWKMLQDKIASSGFFKAVKQQLADLLSFVTTLFDTGMVDTYAKKLGQAYAGVVKGARAAFDYLSKGLDPTLSIGENLSRLWENVKRGVVDTVNFAQAKFAELASSDLGKSIAKGFHDALDTLSSALKGIGGIVEVGKTIYEAIKNGVISAMAFAEKLWANSGSSLIGMLRTVFDYAKSGLIIIAQTYFGLGGPIWKAVFGIVTDIFLRIAQEIVQLPITLAKVLPLIAGFMLTTFAKVTTTFASFLGKSIYESVAYGLTNAFILAKKTFTGLFSGQTVGKLMYNQAAEAAGLPAYGEPTEATNKHTNLSSLAANLGGDLKEAFGRGQSSIDFGKMGGGLESLFAPLKDFFTPHGAPKSTFADNAGRMQAQHEIDQSTEKQTETAKKLSSTNREIALTMGRISRESYQSAAADTAKLAVLLEQKKILQDTLGVQAKEIHFLEATKEYRAYINSLEKQEHDILSTNTVEDLSDQERERLEAIRQAKTEAAEFVEITRKQLGYTQDITQETKNWSNDLDVALQKFGDNANKAKELAGALSSAFSGAGQSQDRILQLRGLKDQLMGLNPKQVSSLQEQRTFAGIGEAERAGNTELAMRRRQQYVEMKAAEIQQAQQREQELKTRKAELLKGGDVLGAAALNKDITQATKERQAAEKSLPNVEKELQKLLDDENERYLKQMAVAEDIRKNVSDIAKNLLNAFAAGREAKLGVETEQLEKEKKRIEAAIEELNNTDMRAPEAGAYSRAMEGFDTQLQAINRELATKRAEAAQAIELPTEPGKMLEVLDKLSKYLSEPQELSVTLQPLTVIIEQEGKKTLYKVPLRKDTIPTGVSVDVTNQALQPAFGAA